MRPRPLLGLPLLLAAACSGGDSSLPSFVVSSVPFAADAAGGVVVSGSRIAFLADESLQGPAGTDLDGDGNTDDLVAVTLNMAGENPQPRVLAAAERIVLIQDRAYLAGYEPGSAVLSVLTVDLSKANSPLVKLDEIDPASTEPIVRAANKAFWVTAAPTAAAGETGLRWAVVGTGEGEVPRTVLAEDLVSTWQPRLLGAEAGIVRFALDESVEGAELNGDGVPGDDAVVLGLADGNADEPLARNVGLALAADDAPVRVRAVNAATRRVAFLVDEAAQGESFNDATRPEFGAGWEFGACAGNDDVDTTDRVLHWLDFEPWAAGTSDPVNTGLVGSDRILLTNSHIATLAAELDQGPGGCDWTQDGNADDTVLRWVSATTSAIVPENGDALQRAVVDVPGGSGGASVLGAAFVAAIEATVTVPAPGSGSVAGTWLASTRPGESTNWKLFAADPSGAGGFPLAPDWLAAAEAGGRLGATFSEAPYGTSFNQFVCNSQSAKDTDAGDAIPLWLSFDDGSNTLFFPGIGFALAPGNAGVTVAAGRAFFRVSEAGDGKDYNGDGSLDDFVLFRNDVGGCAPTLMGPLNALDAPAVVTDGSFGAAFLADETLSNGKDFNQDGDSDDFVLRWFRF